MKNIVRDYPRPQFYRDDWENLCGEWDFKFDKENKGESSKWFAGIEPDEKIIVPFVFESKASGIDVDFCCEHVWYQRNYHYEKTTDQRIILHFEGVDYHTKVWVNSFKVGENKGAYNRFSFDITDYLVNGENIIVVKADDIMDSKQPRGKQRWVDRNYGCWYRESTGIWKPVWIEKINANHIDYVKMTPSYRNGTLSLDFDLNVDDYGNKYFIDVNISFKEIFINSCRIPVLSNRASIVLDLRNKENMEILNWDIKTWTPEEPNLYDIEFVLSDGTQNLDKIESYFGLREITIEGSKIFMNDMPLIQRLILNQGYWENSLTTPPDGDAIKADVIKIKEMGYNGVRIHQKTEDERFLYWCDKLGLYVWCETGSAYCFDDQTTKEFTDQWMKTVKQYYNFPSVIAWVPFNESWGIQHIKSSVKQQSLPLGIYYLTKTFDSMRPVIANDGWEHTKTDIITLHDYGQNGEQLFNKFGTLLENVLTNELQMNDHKCAFAHGYKYEGQPIIISEYGGTALDEELSGWGYGDSVRNEEDFLQRFKELVDAIKDNPRLAGYCYTQFCDVQQEINGLLDENHKYKFSKEKIREINLRNVKGELISL